MLQFILSPVSLIADEIGHTDIITIWIMKEKAVNLECTMVKSFLKVR